MFSPTESDGLLKISGIDAKKFLQGQLTCDVEAISEKTHSLGAHCNPQGRVISLFRLHQHQGAYYLLMSRDLVPITLNALKKYAVFFKVELTDATDKLAELSKTINLETYRDILHGIPAIYPETSGKFLPHDLNLHESNTIDFHKGCYTGQEIIARMHYKATRKNHLYHATINRNINVKPGEDIYNLNHNIVGTIVDAIDLGQHYYVLLITDSSNAKNEYLFLQQHHDVFFTIREKI
jgi:folate-binding protein YgfZ